MKIGLTLQQRILIAIIAFTIAVIGFMLKLPSGFRHIDKELHATFYFLAAAFLNVLFAKRNFLIHAVIFAGLYIFGMAIEFAQAYSNNFFRTRIHGRYDPEDVQSNLEGLIFFSVLWLFFTVLSVIYNRVILKNDRYNSKMP